MSYLVEDTVKCDECGSRNLSKDESRGEVVCDDCGLVLAVSYTHLTLPTKA